MERQVDDGEKLYHTMPASLTTTSLPAITPPPSPSCPDETAGQELEHEHDPYSQNFENNVEERVSDNVVMGVCRSMSVPETLEVSSDEDYESLASESSVVKRRTGCTAIKRRAGGRRSRSAKLRRR